MDPAEFVNPEFRYLPSRSWHRPAEVEFRDGLLVPTGVAPRPAEARPKMLEEFLAIATARESRLVAFAKRYGMLGLCGHGVPGTHHPLAWYLECGGRGPEPVDTWRAYSHAARAILEAARYLHDNKPIPPAALDTIEHVMLPFDAAALRTTGELLLGLKQTVGPHRFPPMFFIEQANTYDDQRRGELRRRAAGNVADGRKVLRAVVNWWLGVARVRPLLDWPNRGAPSVGLGCELRPGTGLLGAIGVALLSHVVRTDALDLCHGCGAPFVVSRKRRPGVRRYCDACRADRVPARDWARARRAAAQKGGWK